MDFMFRSPLEDEKYGNNSGFFLQILLRISDLQRTREPGYIYKTCKVSQIDNDVPFHVAYEASWIYIRHARLAT